MIFLLRKWNTYKNILDLSKNDKSHENHFW